MAEGLAFRNGKLSVRGQKAVIANMNNWRTNVLRRLRTHTAQTGVEVRDMAKTVSPYRTGRMRRSITLNLSPKGFAFEVFYDPQVFARDGEPYYAVFVELGTRLMPAWPTISWAYDINAPRYAAGVRDILRRSSR
jgi:hypothetical protein